MTNYRLRLILNNQTVTTFTFNTAPTTGSDTTDVWVQLGRIADISVVGTPDFSSGTGTFVLEGGTNYAEQLTGTVGLPNSNKDLILPRNPATNRGYRSDLRIRSPRILDDSTAPLLLAPTLTATPVNQSEIQITLVNRSQNHAGHRVYRKTAAGSTTRTLIATLTPSTLTYTDGGLSSETSYWYEAVAYKDAAESDVSNETTAKTKAIVSVLTVPGLSAVQLSATSIRVTVVNNSGSAATAHKVFQKSAAGGARTLIASPTPQNLVVDVPNLTTGSTYFFDATSTDGVTETTHSVERSVTLASTQAGVGAPASFELFDWTNSATPTLVGSIKFDVTGTPMTFEDTEIADEMGIVQVRESSTSIVWNHSAGGFEFGGIVLQSRAENNLVVTTEPRYEVLIGCKPHGRWASYPAMDTYNQATDITFPPAFKGVLKNAQGQILHTFEMRDGKPINDPSLSQDRAKANDPLRPHFNCGMLLPWQSARSAPSSRAKKFFNGMSADALRPSQAKKTYSVNGAMPMLTYGAGGRNQNNGMNHWYYAPDWSLGWNSGPNGTIADTNLDIHCFNPNNIWTGEGAHRHLMHAAGWRYEPGATGTHDWFVGPGGMRFDRSVVPTVMAIYATDPNWKRPKDDRPIRDFVDDWGLCYFNHAGHWLRDVKKFAYLPNNETIPGDANRWSFAKAYYGQRDDYVPGGRAKHINMVAISNGDYDDPPAGLHPSRFYDKTGRRVWNGWIIDDQHSYQAPGWWAMMFRSPMFAVAAKAHYMIEFMSALGAAGVTGIGWGTALSRVHFWRWLHMGQMWKLASTQPNIGMPRDLLQARFIAEVEHFHDDVVAGTQNSRTTNMFAASFYNLGCGAHEQFDGAGNKRIMTGGGPMAFYGAHVLAMMKQNGSWAMLYNANAKCKAALDWIIARLDQWSVDFILDTDGRAEWGGETELAPWMPVNTPYGVNDLPKSWAVWAQRYPKAAAPNDKWSWIRHPDGVLVERYTTQHLRAQWVKMRKDYFPEFPNPRLDAAIAKYQGYYDEWAAEVAKRAVGGDRTNADWTYRTPPLAFLAPPPPTV